MQKLMSRIRAAMEKYNMVDDGDRIAVGLSGGKDSVALLAALAEMRRFYPKKFEVVPVNLRMGFPEETDEVSRALCEELGLELKSFESEIYSVVFEVRKEKSPCSLCANMRRGALHNASKELGCNKLALGHHFDDAVETFMLNLFFEGRIGCFSPVTYLSRIDIHMIRPLLYAPEKDVRYFASKAELPVVKSTCPADGNTQREEMKTLLRELDLKHKGLRYRIFGAIQRGEIDGFHDFGKLDGIKEYSDEISGDA